MNQSTLIARWAQFFITKYKTTILLVVGIVIAGTWGVMNNQRQDFPTIASNYIFITATQVGASAEDIEQEVLLPLEQSVAEIDGLNIMRSSASDNLGFITLDMADVEGTPDAAAEVEKRCCRRC